MKALNETKDNTTTGTSDANPDKEFQERMNRVREQLQVLLSRAEDTSVNDKELMKRLDAINKTLSTIETKLQSAEASTNDAKENARNASAEIGLAEDSIEKSNGLVHEIRRATDQTARIINQIYRILANLTVTTKIISETVINVSQCRYKR